MRVRTTLTGRFTRGQRPAAVAARLAHEGRRALERTFPERDKGADTREPVVSPAVGAREHEVRLTRSPGGTVRGLNRRDLELVVCRTGAVLEFVPTIGQHIDRGAVLYRVHGALPADAARRLERSVVLGHERAVDHDPGCAFRRLADLAVRALSPAAKDPSTAVQVIDWLQALLADAAGRQLGTGAVPGPHGTVLAVYRSATWEDLVALSFEEILYYGREDLQVTRRMRAALDDLLDVVPEDRRPPLVNLRHRLESTTVWSFEQTGTRAVALQPDRLGLGGAATPPPARSGRCTVARAASGAGPNGSGTNGSNGSGTSGSNGSNGANEHAPGDSTDTNGAADASQPTT